MPEETTSPGLDFRILGTFECLVDGDPVVLRGPLQERLLVQLLLSRRRIVPLDLLVEAVWDSNSPCTAVHQVRKMIADLRRRVPALRHRLVTAGAGYRLVLREEEVDHGRFLGCLDRARELRAAGDEQGALAALTHGLAQWRGRILDGGAGLLIGTAAVALDERRIAAMEQAFGIRLAAGESGSLISELRAACDACPTHEALRGQLMLGLYRAGRQAEALEEYHALRRTIDAAHAVEPGAGLASLYQRILRGDPGLAVPRSVPRERPPAPAAGAVSTLPHGLSDFVGRRAPLDALLALAAGAAAQAAAGPAGIRVIAVHGMGGCGKSALAVHAAHLLAGGYPDGQLHLDLQGFTPGARPLESHEALGVLLGSLGLPAQAVPAHPQTRLARWRTLTAGRRLLLVLDNAARAEQVRPLLPNSPGSLVLVTGRVRFPYLDGAAFLPLGMLPADESLRLLGSVLGPARTEAELPAARRIAELCGNLPLALRLCAVRLRQQADRSLGRFAERLAAAPRILRELSAGGHLLEPCLGASFASLGAEMQQHALRLGGIPGREFGVPAAAAALGLGPDRTDEVLEHLTGAHLLEQRAGHRYGFHRLMGALLAERAAAARPPVRLPDPGPCGSSPHPAGPPGARDILSV